MSARANIRVPDRERAALGVPEIAGGDHYRKSRTAATPRANRYARPEATTVMMHIGYQSLIKGNNGDTVAHGTVAQNPGWPRPWRRGRKEKQIST